MKHPKKITGQLRKNIMKLINRYVIGCHVMFYEIEIYKEYIEGLINLLETVDNKENVCIDLSTGCNRPTIEGVSPYM